MNYKNVLSYLQNNPFVPLRIISLWQNLQPVAIRVFNEIDAHGFIFKANAAHLLMLFVRFFKIIRLKCQMEFTLSQVVSLGVVFQPGKLQLKIAHIAS